MHKQTAVDSIQNIIGYGDVLEGTLENTYVVVNDLALAHVIYRDLPKKTDTKTMELQVVSQEYTLVSEIENITVKYSRIPRIVLNVKSGGEVFFDVSGDANINVIISAIMLRIMNNKK